MAAVTGYRALLGSEPPAPFPHHPALTPNPGTPEELEALLRRDFERYGALVRKLNLRTE